MQQNGERNAVRILEEMADAIKIGNVKDLNNPQLWINRAFELNILLIDEKKKYEFLRQAVAVKKMQLFRGQEKKNVSAVNIEIEASDEYRDLNIQESLIYAIEEQVRLAKKNTEINQF